MDSRQRLTEKLAAAPDLVKAYFEIPECRWEGRFHQDREACRNCADTVVCEWLFARDPAPDLSALSRAQVRDALSFAAGYLEGRMTEAGHETEQCACAICCWVRDSLVLIQDA